MPGLIACNRRWDIGSDDLLFPASMEMAFRMMWFIVILVIYSLHNVEADINCSYYMEIFYLSRIVFICVHVFLDILIIYTSTRGSIMDPSRRRHMAKILYVKAFVFLPEFILYALGTYWTFAIPNNCPKYIIVTAKVAVIGGWLFLFFLLVAICIVFDPLGSQSQSDRVIHGNPKDGSSPDLFPEKASAKRLWELRCKLLCCCAMDDEHSKNALNDVAHLLTNYFEGLDFVPTDLASGLILVQYEQTTEPRSLIHEPLHAISYTEQPQPSNGHVTAANSDITTETSGGRFPNPKPWMTVHEAAWYMRYALASYTWPLYIFMNPMTGCCKLMGGCRCCSCSPDNGVIHDDNCCQCHLAAIRKITGCDQEDIVYASFINRIYETPFYVVLDHNQKTVVVAIRGTLSLRDALTDMTAECSNLDIEGLGTVQAHKGILQAAKYVQQKLQENHILDQAFERGPGYRLLITGHSLGAGTAALLTVLLRPAYPDVICFSFSPPGGLISLPLSRYTESFICSVVVGLDIIPRLGMVTLEDLKIKVLRCIRDSGKPKYKILAGGATRAFCGCGSPSDDTPTRRHLLEGSAPRTHYTVDMAGNSDLEQLEADGLAPGDVGPESAPNGAPESDTTPASASLHPSHEHVITPAGGGEGGVSNPCLTNDEDIETQIPKETNKARQAIDDAIVSASRARMTHIALFPPGQVIFIEENNPERGMCGEAIYEAAWARADVFDEIIVSPKMVTDHLPDLVMKALQQLVDRSQVPQYHVKKQETSPVSC